MQFNDQFEAFVKIPKLELHAHLNGSLSQNTLKKLYNLKVEKCKNVYELDTSCLYRPSGDMSDCFKLFSVVHNLTDNPEAVYMATCDVIKEFLDDGVYYLELRTTPRETESCMTQESYVETVLKAMDKTMADLNGKILVKLILSIDRKRNFQFAEETIKIAEKYFTCSKSVIGIDFSGDPTIGDVKIFTPLLEYAKKVGLKLAIHTAEVPDTNHEVKELLQLYPDRLGHGTFLHPSKGGTSENFATLNKLKIPLEICLTSNVISKTVPSYEGHHFQLFKDMSYPCVLCTDDKGIFNTTLSREYYLASHYYSFTKSDLYNLSYNSINYIFSNDSIKDDLRKLWKN